ncbi:MAG: hypothetical protein GX490_07400 [Bacilli bacterium]|nr:hypothetical protein [Bacilli bacterium]
MSINIRGPFYKDVEISLYYLNSRYYNPEVGRFLNADGLIGSVGDILGHNIYAYTQNKPVMMVDPNGEFAITTF